MRKNIKNCIFIGLLVAAMIILTMRVLAQQTVPMIWENYQVVNKRVKVLWTCGDTIALVNTSGKYILRPEKIQDEFQFIANDYVWSYVLTSSGKEIIYSDPVVYFKKRRKVKYYN